MRITEKKADFDFGENCFDLLRLYSAIHVMTQHIMRYIILREMPDTVKWFNGVVVLFLISGFLVPASMERSKDTWDFLKKRVLRIVPSLWICIIVGVLVAGAFCGFVFDKTFGVWFAGQLAFIRDFPQPQFITDFGHGTFQGSLWTMIFTVQFYIITALVYPLMKRLKIVGWSVVLLITIAFNLAMPYIQATVPAGVKLFMEHTCLPYLYIYFAGWFMYRYREKIVPVLSKTKILSLILFLGRAIYCTRFNVRIGEYQDMIQVILLCMLTVGVAYSFGKIRFKFDLSYGLYLYHMIVVDVFVQIGMVGKTSYLIAVYAVSLACAVVSHFLVDNNIARLFNRKKTERVEIQKMQPKAEKVPVMAIDEETDF